MTPARLDTLTWACLYGGALGLMLGGWSVGADATLGRLLLLGGGALLLVGAVLVWRRSRIGRRGPGDRR